MGTILAIDPGNTQSGYVVVEHDGEEIRRVLEAGKKGNNELLPMLERKLYGNGHDVAIEMIAGMGMTVGQEVFDTCVWIGRFWQTVLWQTGYGPTRIFRREEKLDLCGSLSAKDANIRQALVDRYAPGQPNFGKGTKKDPGFFYGFSADMWAAMAVAVTYFDKYILQSRLWQKRKRAIRLRDTTMRTHRTRPCLPTTSKARLFWTLSRQMPRKSRP